MPPRDPDALADRLVHILSDPELAHRMGRAARARVETEFSLRASVAATEHALDGAGADGSAPGSAGAVDRRARSHVRGRRRRFCCSICSSTSTRESLRRGWCACAKPARSPTSSGRPASTSRFSTGRADSTCAPCPALSVPFARARTDAVLVTHHHRASLALGRIAARMARVPVNIVAAHDMDLTSVGQRVLPRWAVNTLAFSDALVLLSPGQGEYLHREEGVGQRLTRTTREVVIPNGISCRPPPPAADRLRARTILGCRRIRFRRGDRRPAQCSRRRTRCCSRQSRRVPRRCPRSGWW